MPRSPRQSKGRFAVYADFLGTKERYSRPTLIVRGRELLEQALARCVLPRMAADDLNLYVFSDTAIITCPHLGPLLQPTAELFWHFLKFRSDVQDPMNLWLRAGISHGRVLTVDHLRNTDHVRTIPFLDPSLPAAYRLESIRRGSRVFVDPAISSDALKGHDRFFFRWKSITGNGIHVAHIGEFLWPMVGTDGPNRLRDTTFRLHRRWLDTLGKKEWPRDEYYRELIHLDETLKLFIRSAALDIPEVERRAFFYRLLPTEGERHNNLRYKWGLWFQALRGLVEYCEMDGPQVDEFLTAFQSVQQILKRGRYLEHFLGELEFPDYDRFKAGLTAIGALAE